MLETEGERRPNLICGWVTWCCLGFLLPVRILLSRPLVSDTSAQSLQFSCLTCRGDGVGFHLLYDRKKDENPSAARPLTFCSIGFQIFMPSAVLQKLYQGRTTKFPLGPCHCINKTPLFIKLHPHLYRVQYTINHYTALLTHCLAVTSAELGFNLREILTSSLSCRRIIEVILQPLTLFIFT